VSVCIAKHLIVFEFVLRSHLVLVLPAATSSPFEKAQAQAMVQAAAQAQAVVAAAKNRGGGLVPLNIRYNQL
jgi:hypothetical protein